MGSRGRTPASELSVISSGGIETTQRPRPPIELSDEQSQEWVAVVNRLPADWFPRETHALLTQYCRHVVYARRVDQLIQALFSSDDGDELDLDKSDKLLKMLEREGRALSSHATRLRITPQATYDPKKKKPKGAAKPWE